MVFDMNYWLKVLKQILIVVGTVLGLWLAYKLAVFYMPFLIGFIISMLVEPIIRFLMRKTKLSRKTSTFITLIVVLSLIVYLLFLGISNLVHEAIYLLKDMNIYVEKFQVLGNNLSERFNSISVPEEIKTAIEGSYSTILSKVSTWATGALTSILNVITSIPVVGIYIVITILATVFICKDKVYILDQFEHHVPKKWMAKVTTHAKEIISSLKDLLKAQLIMIGITFVELLIGFYILSFLGFNIEFPLIAALVTGLVDMLPILRSRYSTYSLGSNCCIKWRYLSCNWFNSIICNNCSCKANNRAKNSKQTDWCTSNIYVTCYVYWT